MPEIAKNSEKKYRIIIYHGHLHKIPIGDIGEKSEDENLATAEEGIE
jgi:hypothetical protein